MAADLALKLLPSVSGVCALHRGSLSVPSTKAAFFVVKVRKRDKISDLTAKTNGKAQEHVSSSSINAHKLLLYVVA